MHAWIVWKKDLEGRAEAQLWAGAACMAAVSADSQAGVAHLLTSSRTGPGKPAASWGRAVATTAGSCCLHEDMLRRECLLHSMDKQQVKIRFTVLVCLCRGQTVVPRGKLCSPRTKPASLGA